ncbi:MAG: ATP cone domain-containing protein, partial [Angelakisella sp.]
GVRKTNGPVRFSHALTILNSMVKACEKRTVPFDVLEKAANDIEQQLLNSLNREVKSQDIGELVMDSLKAIDEVAYVRFASVYRQFKDIGTFRAELNKLLGSSDTPQ